MHAVVQDAPTEVIAAWRTGEQAHGQESPAGPVFAGGVYAEHELTMNGNCSAGTASCIFHSTLMVFCC